MKQNFEKEVIATVKWMVNIKKVLKPNQGSERLSLDSKRVLLSSHDFEKKRT